MARTKHTRQSVTLQQNFERDREKFEPLVNLLIAKCQLLFALSTNQMFSRQLQPLQISQHSDRDLVRMEESVGHFDNFFRCDRLDLLNGFIQAEEAPKIHLL